MNTNIKNILKYTLILGAGLLLGWLLFGLPAPDEHVHEHTEGEATSTGTTWTCSMHPQIRQPEAGKCPICGMDLIPVSQAGEDADDPMVLKMSNHAVQLANIQTSRVGYGGEQKELLLNGKVQEDERRIHSQTAHFSGRIEQLFINFTGEQVYKGQKVAAVYSPPLITAQEELLEAKKYKDSNPALLEAARRKLKHWKLSDIQVQRIEESGKVQHELNIQSDYSGVVTEKKIALGEHVEAGTVLYEIADLSRVWITFDAYEQDLRWIKEGDEIRFTAASLPGKTFTARITFIDPVIDPQTRVAQVRTEVSNTDKLLKPEMFVKGTITTSSAEDEQALTVPKSAVMWTGTRSIVYVKVPDADPPAFQLREVTLGTSLSDSYVIEAGLEPGEEIVTHGTFTVDAAAQLQGKRSMMNQTIGQEGGQSHAGHRHSIDYPETSFSVSTLPDPKDFTDRVPEAFQDQLENLVQAYLPLKDRLVEGQEAQKAGATFVMQLEAVDMNLLTQEAQGHWMEIYPVLKENAEKLQHAQNIEEQRLFFINVSNALINAVKSFGTETTLYLQHCPMANSDQGAEWLSREETVKNPYFGERMLTCGWVEESIHP